MSRPAVLALDGGLQLSLNHVHLPQSVWLNHIGCEPSSYAEGLRYNLPASRPLAATVLSDASPSPSALYIIPPGAGPDYRSTLDELVAESPLPAWIWNAGESAMPVLPQQERIVSARKAAAMRTKGGSMVSGSGGCENREACFCAT